MELDFEKPILEIERKIAELKTLSREKRLNVGEEIKRFEQKLVQAKKEVYTQLTPWQRVQLARHPRRPYTLDYIGLLMTQFVELHGDRLFGDDKAMIGGFAMFEGRKVMVIGHQKGRDTKENLMRNFGSAHPEGYRKALRLMQMAEKFHLPIVVFIDTPGAYPGIGAEERGQSQAIALNLREMAQFRVPIMCIVIGEGGSGGALGIGVGDRIAVLENAYYSVISPEGCAAILWKDRAKAPEAASALKMTAADLLELGLIDDIVKEPLGGAHRDPQAVAQRLRAALLRFFKLTNDMPLDTLVQRRYDRFRRLGVFTSQPNTPIPSTTPSAESSTSAA